MKTVFFVLPSQETELILSAQELKSLKVLIWKTCVSSGSEAINFSSSPDIKFPTPTANILTPIFLIFATGPTNESPIERPSVNNTATLGIPLSGRAIENTCVSKQNYIKNVFIKKITFIICQWFIST